MTLEIAEDFAKLPSKEGDNNYKKTVGLFVQKEGNVRHPSAMFAMLNEKYNVIDKYVMKVIRPTGNAIKYE